MTVPEVKSCDTTRLSPVSPQIETSNTPDVHAITRSPIALPWRSRGATGSGVSRQSKDGMFRKAASKQDRRIAPRNAACVGMSGTATPPLFVAKSIRTKRFGIPSPRIDLEHFPDRPVRQVMKPRIFLAHCPIDIVLARPLELADIEAFDIVEKRSVKAQPPPSR